MKSKNWSERLDARIIEWMKRIPAPPLWLLLAMQGLALIMMIVLLAS
ncbi:hypothetical protein [Mesorhizobium sp.]|nr:hypothetical protein [Mesorhizobium sp.]